MSDVDIEKELIEGLARQVADDVDWVFINTRWVWNDNAPGWVKWLSRFRVFFWIARRKRLNLGQWYCPDPPRV